MESNCKIIGVVSTMRKKRKLRNKTAKRNLRSIFEIENKLIHSVNFLIANHKQMMDSFKVIKHFKSDAFVAGFINKYPDIDVNDAINTYIHEAKYQRMRFRKRVRQIKTIINELSRKPETAFKTEFKNFIENRNYESDLF